ncbi:MAG: HD domain-containing protein [Rhodospirillaceae bacterium]|nr:HD domain-containing protein [Rhodospirillaceae bacterium]
MRAKLHYTLAAVIIPVYGAWVCPFIDSLSAWQIAAPIIGVLAVQYALHRILQKSYVAPGPLKRRASRTFWVELGLFMSAAAILALYNNVLYEFPLESGLKLLAGLSSLGFFAALDLALEAERSIIAEVTAGGRPVSLDGRYLPLNRKLAIFATVMIFMLMGLMILLVSKDLRWIVAVSGMVSLETARISIIKEFMFVLAVMLPHALNVIHSFALNLSLFLDAQRSVLSHVTAGDYTHRIPISSNDEFGEIARDANQMVDRIRERTEEVIRTQDVTILSLASLAEARDNETGAHILRTQRYVRVLAEALQDHPRFSDYLDDETIELLFKSAPLHDIGKVGIPDDILLKPGAHTDREREIMKTHAKIGADALAVAERELGATSFLRLAGEIALTHHEKWDGGGYPNGLRGDDIPVSGRLMAVADVYDALITKRVYKPAFTHKKAMEILQDGRGGHFDPDVIDAMIAREDDFRAIAKAYADEGFSGALLDTVMAGD